MSFCVKIHYHEIGWLQTCYLAICSYLPTKVCIDAFCCGVDLAKWWPKTSFLLKTSRSFCSAIAPRCLFEGGEFIMKVCSQILGEPLLCRREKIRKIQKEKRGKVSSLPRAMEKGETEQSAEFADHWMATWSSLGQHWKKREWLPTVLGNSNLKKNSGRDCLSLQSSDHLRWM